MLLGLFDAAEPRFGFGHDDESMTLEQPTRDPPEVGVVVDDQNTARHGAIVPADRALRSVAGPPFYLRASVMT